jgi:hypothetical protein
MKLLIIYHSGLADDAKYIFKEYAKQGIDLTVIVPLKNGLLVYGPEHSESAFTFIALPFKAAFNFSKLFGAIKKIKPDVIHVIDEYTSLSLFQAIVCRNLLSRKKVPIFSLSFQNMPLVSPPLVFHSPTAFLRRVIHKIALPLIVRYHKKNVAGVVCGNKDAGRVLSDMGIKIPQKFIFSHPLQISKIFFKLIFFKFIF